MYASSPRSKSRRRCAGVASVEATQVGQRTLEGISSVRGEGHDGRLPAQSAREGDIQGPHAHQVVRQGVPQQHGARLDRPQTLNLDSPRRRNCALAHSTVAPRWMYSALAKHWP
jgi:hypothetical protein